MLQNAFLESILQHDLNLNATLKLTSSSKTDSQGLTDVPNAHFNLS